MKYIYYIFIILILISCGNSHEKPIIKSNSDSIKAFNDSIDKLRAVYDREKLIQEQNIKPKLSKEDSLMKHTTDSLLNLAKYIKQHRQISINERILRIKKLYNSFGLGDLWRQCGMEDYNIDEIEIIANEIGFLLTDKEIVNYNIDSIFSNIGKYIDVLHSDDNKIWIINFPIQDGGTADAPENIICWRDNNNVPMGFITCDTVDFENRLAYFYNIYKLKSISKSHLYLLIGFSKGLGNIAYVLELNSKGLNWSYRGFKTKYKGYNPIKGKAITYDIGSFNDDNTNYTFDTVLQTLKYKSTYRDSIIKGTLTFNGYFFEENVSTIKKRK